MRRAVLLAVAAIIGASAARAGAPSAWERERERQRREEARRLIEGSGEFSNYWRNGETKWRELDGATYDLPAADLPAVPDTGAEAGRIGELIAKFTGSPIAEKMEARNALAKIGAAATKPLAQAMQADDAGMRSSAAIVLKKVGRPCMAAVLPLTDHEKSSVRSNARGVVSKIATRADIGAIVARIEAAKHPDCRSGLMGVLKKLLTIKDLDVILAIITNCRNKDLRRMMAGAAAASGDIKALPVLIGLGKDPDPLFRKLSAAGVQMLSQRPRREQVPMLFAAWKSSTGPVKAALAKALQRASGRNPNGESERDWKFYVYVNLTNADWPPPRR